MTTKEELDLAVAALKQTLEQSNLDYDSILSLAAQIAQSQEGKVRFSVDAGLINRLGLELVSKQETAVAELVKNAYDADAVKVDLIFRSTSAPGGSLEIIDNGVGMSRDQLIDGFMRLSTQSKITNPASEKFQRKRAGRKGIGRFAAQRLGKRLIVRTRRDGEPKGLEVKIDWDKLEPGKDLMLVTHEIMEINLASTGTTLLIEDLRDSWDTEHINRSYRYVSTLQPPFPISKTAAPHAQLSPDPGFKAAFFVQEGDDLKTVADEELFIRQHALAIISGHVDGSGRAFWSMDCSRYSINVVDQSVPADPENQKSSFRFLRDVRFSAAYFIVQTDLLPKLLYGQIRETLEQWGGIRVYRNGFRVLPYGEPFDDWLRLERSSALRQILPPHRNRNFIGHIDIDDPTGRFLEETASREGLVENEAYDELRTYVERALKLGAIAVAEKRGRKVRTQDKTPKPKRNMTQLFKELRSVVGSNIYGLRRVEVLEDELATLGAAHEELIGELSMLRILGSLGLAIGEFTHEIRHNLSALIADALTAIGQLTAKSPAKATVERLQSNLNLLRSYARYFDEAVADNTHRELVPHEMRDVLNTFERVVAPSVKRAAIKLEVSVDGYDLYTRPMHRSEWASLLLNLYTNSLKAIKRAGRPGRIQIRAGEEDGKIFLEFSDNGDGIPSENVDRIFDAFFTTSTPPGPLASYNEELIGAGLGLKISRDIIESHEGEISLVSAPKHFSTCFRIQVPKATLAELGNEKS